MTSTIMRNSRLPDDWLRQACAQNPIQPIDARFLSGPVRLAFPSLFTPKEQKRDKGDVSHLYEVTMLFPPFVDLSLPWNAAEQMAATKWPKNIVDGQLVSVGLPFTSQNDKSIKYEGFTPGGWKLTARTKFKPRILDVNGNEITDQSRVYYGVWAILDFNFYATEIKGNRINTSVNIVYLFADDTSLGGGGGPDPSKGLAQVKAMAPVMGPPGTVVPTGAPTPQAPATGHGAAPNGYTPPGVPQTYQNAPNVAPPPAAPAYAPPATSYAAPVQTYAPVVETEEQRMLREAGLA